MPHDDPIIDAKRFNAAWLPRFWAGRMRTDAILVEMGLDPHPPSPVRPSTTPPTPTPELLSVSDAANLSGVSKKRIYHLIKTGQVRCVRHSNARNSHLNVVWASLVEWIDEQSR